MAGWSIHPFASLADPAVDGDHLLLDVRPVPGVLPEQPKEFRLHACLMVPLEVSNEGTRVEIRSPLWRERTDIPDTALFAVYRRKKGQGDDAWREIVGQLLSFEPAADYAFDRVSELRVVAEGTSLQLVLDDRTGDPGGDYDYRVEHRCALDANPEHSKRRDDDLAPAFEIRDYPQEVKETLYARVD